MINRRSILLSAAALAFAATSASAQDYKAKYPELTFAIIPAENASASPSAGRPSSPICRKNSA